MSCTTGTKVLCTYLSEERECMVTPPITPTMYYLYYYSIEYVSCVCKNNIIEA